MHLDLTGIAAAGSRSRSRSKTLTVAGAALAVMVLAGGILVAAGTSSTPPAVSPAGPGPAPASNQTRTLDVNGSTMQDPPDTPAEFDGQNFQPPSAATSASPSAPGSGECFAVASLDTPDASRPVAIGQGAQPSTIADVIDACRVMWASTELRQDQPYLNSAPNPTAEQKTPALVACLLPDNQTVAVFPSDAGASVTCPSLELAVAVD